MVVVADVYAAGEQPIDGINKEALVEGLQAHGHRQVMALSSPEALAPLVREHAKSGDLVVCLGAGNITQWANALPAQLEAGG
jgi:UDP-N-acetylmuramate--alanine ligase